MIASFACTIIVLYFLRRIFLKINSGDSENTKNGENKVPYWDLNFYVLGTLLSQG